MDIWGKALQAEGTENKDLEIGVSMDVVWLELSEGEIGIDEVRELIGGEIESGLLLSSHSEVGSCFEQESKIIRLIWDHSVLKTGQNGTRVEREHWEAVVITQARRDAAWTGVMAVELVRSDLILNLLQR